MALSVYTAPKKAKPTNLVREQTVPQQEDYYKEIIKYGDEDNFPLRLSRLVQNSPTGSSCISTKGDFVEGGGFSKEIISDLKINGRGQRFGEIHSLVSDSVALFEGFALNIKYSANQRITEIFFIPFENCRFKEADSKGVINKIQVNPYFGTGIYRKYMTSEYDTYNPEANAVKKQQERDGKKYKGQILYCGTTGPLNRFYPIPRYYSAKHYLKCDEAIGGFHAHNIDNGFFQSVMIKMIGNENETSQHPDDMKWDTVNNQYIPDPRNTVGMRFNIEMQKFSGWEKAGNIMALWAKAKEAMPEVVNFPATSNAELFKVLGDMTTENIARSTNVPSILANIQSGATLGGDGNQIRASVKLMQQRVVKVQRNLERTYTDLFARMETPMNEVVKIIHYNPFPELEKVDPLIWAAMTVPEQRKWISDNTEYQLFDNPTNVTPAATPTPANKFEDVFFAEYPAGAKETCQKALTFRSEMKSKCGTPMGWQWCQDIIDGKPLSFKQIKRIYNFLSKKLDFKNGVFSESCESLLFACWGGEAMLDWASDKIKSINE